MLAVADEQLAGGALDVDELDGVAAGGAGAEEDAEQLGVGVEEEAPRKKYDLDREEIEV